MVKEKKYKKLQAKLKSIQTKNDDKISELCIEIGNLSQALNNKDIQLKSNESEITRLKAELNDKKSSNNDKLIEENESLIEQIDQMKARINKLIKSNSYDEFDEHILKLNKEYQEKIKKRDDKILFLQDQLEEITFELKNKSRKEEFNLSVLMSKEKELEIVRREKIELSEVIEKLNIELKHNKEEINLCKYEKEILEKKQIEYKNEIIILTEKLEKIKESKIEAESCFLKEAELRIKQEYDNQISKLNIINKRNLSK